MSRTFKTIGGVPHVSINGRRHVPEWIGKTPDAMPSTMVRLRIFEGCGGICLLTGTVIRGKRWVCAHKMAIADEGENREANIFPALESAHQQETGRENSQRATERRKKARDVGAKQTGKNWKCPTRINPETGRKERHTGFRWKEM